MKTIKIEHIWCDKNDRWIYLEYNEENKICGMNFMQGDEYEEFKVNWVVNDSGLMEFYTEMLYTFPIEKASVDKFTFINKCMWAYFSAQDKSRWWPEGEVAAAKLSGDITFTGSMGAD